MAGLDDDFGTRVHCRELSSGKYYSGTLLIADKEITADLFAFAERYIDVDEEEPIHLQTQNLNIVSLHSNIAASSGTAFRQTDDPRLRGLYHTRISSLMAVIGPSPWLTTDEVKSAYFEIGDSSFMLRHSEKMDRLAESELGSGVERNLFTVNVDELTIRADYGASYVGLRPMPDKIFASFSIDFVRPRTLHSYLQEVLAVNQLFAASAGLPLAPKRFEISRRTLDQRISADREDHSGKPHFVKYLWPEVAFDKTMVWAGSSFLLSTDDEELDALKACLVAWIERRHDWKKANDLMLSCLTLRKEASANRFLTAWRWFEEIPLTKVQQAIAGADIDTIANVAAAKASELGYSEISGRILGALRRISDESQKSRFQRLLQSIRSRFRVSVLDDEIVGDLMRATELRGKAAHGHFDVKTEHEHILFVRSLFAIEAVCYLLTVKDLPMSAQGSKRAIGNPFVQNFKQLPPIYQH